MEFVRAAWFHLRTFFDRSKVDAELELELRDHIERETRANIGRGMSEGDARRAALIAFGGVQQYKEETRHVRGAAWLEDGVQDLRYAFRALRRAPGFTVVAILTLALGVGATSAVFSVVDGVLLRPLPFRDPGALYAVSYLPADLPFRLPPSLVDRLFLSFQERQTSFERVTAYQRSQVTLSDVGDAVRLTGARVGAEFFAVLGVSPARGRTFLPDEDQPGRESVVILSDQLWRQRFGADANVVGRTITLDGNPHTVVGIAPPGFDFPASAQIWTPIAIRLETRNTFIIPVVGRLRRGMTSLQARNELETIAASLPRDPRDNGDKSIAAIVPLRDVLTGSVQRSLLVFSGAVGFVLIIAGVNLANLLLIRASVRRHEMALRVSLGASRGRIVRQLLTESMLVSTVGAAAGVIFAIVGVRAFVAMAPEGQIPRLGEVRVDVSVLAFTLAISMATGLIFGLFPALDSARQEPQQALVQGPRTIGHGRVRSRFVMTEIALAFVLLTAAGLMIKSFVRMRSVDTGYDASHVVTMAVDLPSASYPDATRLRRFHGAVLERLGSIPGVRSVGAVSYRPMGGMGIIGDFTVDGPSRVEKGYSVDKPTVSPGYFRAMGIRLISGRDFTTQDDGGAPGVAIVSASMARAVWPNEQAIGKRISMEDKPKAGDWLTVIGVVNDVVQDRPLKAHPALYLPYLQTRPIFLLNHMTYVVRADAGTSEIARAMRAALRDVDAAIPAQALESMDASMRAQVAEPLFQARLLTAFSLLALLLAAIGTYGVLAYDVTERRRDIGIRMALGAGSSRVLTGVMARTMSFAVAGIVIGAAGALAATRVLSRLLFEVTPTDPWTFAGTAVLLTAVALLAGFVPARRASRVDPIIALREE